MRKYIFDTNGFSLIEILMSALIFVVAVAGIFATLNAVRSPVSSKENALTATIFGKQILETLRSQVDATLFYKACSAFNADKSCPDFSLSIGVHEVKSAILSAAGLTWPNPALIALNTLCDASGCLKYTVYCADGSTTCDTKDTTSVSARKVVLNITD